ncbi:MAG: hypothetical protein QOC85_2788, partial [Streptomyces sp.]|nr:hypothetical protein [Streptomyces sp.]
MGFVCPPADQAREGSARSITLEGMADAPYKLILLRHGESEWNA